MRLIMSTEKKIANTSNSGKISVKEFGYFLVSIKEDINMALILLKQDTCDLQLPK